MIVASGSCGRVQSSFEPFVFRFRSIRARSARVGVSMPEPAQLCQEVLIALARVAPHDAAQRRVRLQRRRVDASGLAPNQVRLGEALQHPGEDGLVRLEIDQATRARNRRVIGRRLGQYQPEKLAQRKRIRGTPRQWHARRPSLRNSRSAATESMGSTPRQVLARHHIDACFACRRRLPVAIGDSVVRGINRVDHALGRSRIATHVRESWARCS